MPSAKSVVLVVEDSELIRMLAVDVLDQAGFEVLAAESADEAMTILQGRADVLLVFTDVQMPGSMDGLQLSHRIRERWAPIKLIVTSGKAFVEGNDLPPGARFFAKPYRSQEIVDVIRSLLPEGGQAP